MMYAGQGEPWVPHQLFRVQKGFHIKCSKMVASIIPTFNMVISLCCTHDILLVYFFIICATISVQVVCFVLFSTEVQIFAILLY